MLKFVQIYNFAVVIQALDEQVESNILQLDLDVEVYVQILFNEKFNENLKTS